MRLLLLLVALLGACVPAYRTDRGTFANHRALSLDTHLEVVRDLTGKPVRVLVRKLDFEHAETLDDHWVRVPARRMIRPGFLYAAATSLAIGAALMLWGGLTNEPCQMSGGDFKCLNQDVPKILGYSLGGEHLLAGAVLLVVGLTPASAEIGPSGR